MKWGADHSKPTLAQRNDVVWELANGKEQELADWRQVFGPGTK